jgi:hypothetical protein
MAVTINASTSAGLVMTSDLSGVLTLQQNGVSLPNGGVAPAFRATQATGTAVANTTFTKLLFDTVTFDTNSNFASSRFTPTVAGYYQVTGIVRFSLVSGNFTSPYIYKNGVAYQGMEGCVQSGTNDISGIVTCLVYCNGSTDYIEFYAYQSSGGSKTTITGTTNTSFSACLVRGA